MPFRICRVGPALGGVLWAVSVLAQTQFLPPIPHGPIAVELQNVASGLTSPDLLIPSPDSTNRQFIVDQTGVIRILQNGSLLSTPFLDITSRIGTLVNPSPMPNGLRAGYDERGLLGLAFDPGFNDPSSPGFRRIFTYNSEGLSGTTDFAQSSGTPDNQSVVSSWRVSASDPNVVDPTSRVELMRIDHPQFNHNGGMLAFGPDGMLYISEGDGGGANDGGGQTGANAAGHNPITGNGQDITTPLGKILRIDPNGNNSANGKYGIPASNPFAGGGGLKEIYAYGLRNPYRFSFDGSQLIVGDVGQNNIEEVDNIINGGNYGWRQKEGTFIFNPADGTIGANSPGSPSGLIDPLLEYDHTQGIAVIGGFVYHGSAIPQLDGKYIFGDFSKSFAGPTGQLFYADLTTGQINSLIIGLNDRPLGLFVKGMGIDASGEMYVVGSTTLGPTGTTGVAFKIVPVPEPGMLCLGGALGMMLLGFRHRPDGSGS